MATATPTPTTFVDRLDDPPLVRAIGLALAVLKVAKCASWAEWAERAETETDEAWHACIAALSLSEEQVALLDWALPLLPLLRVKVAAPRKTNASGGSSAGDDDSEGDETSEGPGRDESEESTSARSTDAVTFAVCPACGPVPPWMHPGHPVTEAATTGAVTTGGVDAPWDVPFAEPSSQPAPAENPAETGGRRKAGLRRIDDPDEGDSWTDDFVDVDLDALLGQMDVALGTAPPTNAAVNQADQPAGPAQPAEPGLAAPEAGRPDAQQPAAVPPGADPSLWFGWVLMSSASPTKCTNWRCTEKPVKAVETKSHEALMKSQRGRADKRAALNKVLKEAAVLRDILLSLDATKRPTGVVENAVARFDRVIEEGTPLVEVLKAHAEAAKAINDFSRIGDIEAIGDEVKPLHDRVKELATEVKATAEMANVEMPKSTRGSKK